MGFVKYSINILNNDVQFVKIDPEKYNVILDVKYATEDNFVGKKLYKKPSVYMPQEIAEKLKLAAEYAQKLGYKIKVFDAFRPLNIQRELFKTFPHDGYVSDPDKGVAGHTRGVAIDLTLVEIKTGKELDMGTEFDSVNANITTEQLKNRLILAGIMSICQFTPLPTEWWHYNYRLYKIYPDYDGFYPKRTAKDLNLESEY
jgi:D-alanyl-D-alanine dipeptidase